MRTTTNINDVLEYLDFQLYVEKERARKEGYKFLVVSLFPPHVDDGIADFKLRTQGANSPDEIKNIIVSWGYNLETVTQYQVQIHRLE